MTPTKNTSPRELISEIERLRGAAGISQAEFAERIGLGSQQLWSHYVTGKATHIPFELIVRALGIFGRHLEVYNGVRRSNVTGDAADNS